MEKGAKFQKHEHRLGLKILTQKFGSCFGLGHFCLFFMSDVINQFAHHTFYPIRPRLAGKGAKQLLGHAPAPSKDNLLLNAEPLVNDDDDSFDGDHEVRESRGGRKGSSKTPTKGKYTSFS